ncbi:MAG: glycosyltransferase family 2 protein, partial [Planctomycetes bacterium]|nr:glycosyltransferase family 2 protein [Planctomycetota bacterium]
SYPNVVVVDDGSTDGTWEAARRCATWSARHVINRGQGAALQTGIDLALARGARSVVTFDADGQHRVEDIARLVDPIVRGECDITVGSRFLEGGTELPRLRRLVLRAATLFTRLVNRVHMTDAHNGLRAFSRKAAEGVEITADRMAHASELVDIIRNSGLVFREVPVRVRYTEYSMTKGQSGTNAIRIVLHYLMGRFFP